jgi:hypothetical protein
VTIRWTKKNPVMGMWLRAANSALGRARGPAAAEAAKQRATLATQAIQFWTGAWLASVKPKGRR